MIRKSIENTAWQVLSKGLTSVLALVTTGLLTRGLESNAYGGFILINSMFVFLDSLADFGIKTIGLRELANEKRNLGEIIKFKIILTTVAWLVGLIAVMSLDSFEQFRWAGLVSLSMVWLTSIMGIGEMLWQKNLEMQKKVIIDIAYPLLFILGLLIKRNDLSLTYVMELLLLTRIITLVFGFASLKEDKEVIKIDWKIKVNYGFWKELWPMGVFLLLFAAYDRLVDSIIISSFLGATAVAYYGLGYKIYGVLIQPAYYLVNSVFPLLSKKDGNEKEVFRKTGMLMLLGATAVVTATLLMAPLMVKVLGGDNFEPTIGVLRVLSIGLFLSYFGHLYGFGLIAEGNQKKLLWVGIMGLIINVSLNMLAIPRYGIMGAAWVTVITEAIHSGTMMVLYMGKKYPSSLKLRLGEER